MIEMKQISNPPNATSMMATARSFGNYDLAAAFADLIDNSISANATIINLIADYRGGHNCIFRIRDNGSGMNRDELEVAMRPASKNPEETREKSDLGRFGWGLKSASFSQCRILTVISRKGTDINAARWDLDKIDDWSMGQAQGNDAEILLSEQFLKNGTEIIWENCDRITEGFSIEEDRFNELVISAKNKLSLIFHRFLEAKSGSSVKLQLTLNGNDVKPIDPFCKNNLATQAIDSDTLDIDGKEIKTQAYILPNYNKLSEIEYNIAGGEEGYLRNQGFYVYRNQRLLIHGTWFNLIKHGELSKLVRVQIDIPNSLDEIWKITVDKSDAQLPSKLRKRMKNLVENFKNSSSRVVRTKGARLDNGSDDIWERYVNKGTTKFQINRKNILISTFKNRFKDDQNLIETIFKLVESRLPFETIGKEIAMNHINVLQGHSTQDDFKNVAKPLINLLKKELDITSESELIDKALSNDVFKREEEIVKELIRDIFK